MKKRRSLRPAATYGVLYSVLRYSCWALNILIGRPQSYVSARLAPYLEYHQPRCHGVADRPVWAALLGAGAWGVGLESCSVRPAAGTRHRHSCWMRRHVPTKKDRVPLRLSAWARALLPMATHPSAQLLLLERRALWRPYSSSKFIQCTYFYFYFTLVHIFLMRRFSSGGICSRFLNDIVHLDIICSFHGKPSPFGSCAKMTNSSAKKAFHETFFNLFYT
jgi:hypothetical protein